MRRAMVRRIAAGLTALCAVAVMAAPVGADGAIDVSNDGDTATGTATSTEDGKS